MHSNWKKQKQSTIYLQNMKGIFKGKNLTQFQYIFIAEKL